MEKEFNNWVVGMKIKEYRTTGRKLFKYMEVETFRKLKGFEKGYYFQIAFNSKQEAFELCLLLNNKNN